MIDNYAGYSIADDLSPFSRRVFEAAQKDQAPVVLTVNGMAAAVVQDAEAYQRLLDFAAKTDVTKAIRQGLDDKAHGRSRPGKDGMDDMRRQCGIPR